MANRMRRGGGSSVSGGSPTSGTRAAVRKVQSRGLRAFANGAPTVSAFGRTSLTGAGAGAATTSVSSVPLVGGYLNNLNAVHNNRAAKHHTRAEESNFYYDEWLGLWVETTNSSTSFSQKFYTDQAKTQPAGSIDATFTPLDVFPQTSTYTYAFTGGIMAGTHGSSAWTANADGSGASSYENVTSDGWKFKGSSVQLANGTSTWHNRTDEPDGFYTIDDGTFKADGSSSTKTTSSDGFVAQFINNADGSATGTITGPAAGLPATVIRDTTGRTTIHYADGTIEIIPGWLEIYNDDPGATSGGSGGDSGPGDTSGGDDSGTGGGNVPPPTGL